MNNRLILIFTTVLSLSVPLSAQVKIDAKKESLYEIDLNNQSYDVNFSYNDEEGLNGFEASIVMDDGKLVLYNKYCEDTCYIYKDSILSDTGTVPDISYYDISRPISQNGSIKLDNGIYIIKHKKQYPYQQIFKDSRKNETSPTYVMDVPKGFVCYWHLDNSLLGVEVLNDSLKVIDDVSLNEWLNSQGYSFDKINCRLLKENVVWSPEKASGQGGAYLGKIKNGFNVYYYDDSYLFITDNTGHIVLQMNIPWSVKNNPEGNGNYYCIGSGPYGELYFTIAPLFDVKKREDYKKYTRHEGSNPELAVVRNHLKSFGILTDDRIRLRKEASTSSESLGTYPKNTGFYIIERGTKEETIGSDKGIWYHVRLLDGTEGWFFGAYVRDLYEGPGTPLPWPNVADWD